MIVHVVGMTDSGKSTLVRRVMSGFAKNTPHFRSMTGASWHELVSPEKRMLVFGNYADVGRVPYGLTHYDRRTGDFQKDFAEVLADGRDVLVEGGLLRCRPFFLCQDLYVARARVVVIGKIADWYADFVERLKKLGCVATQHDSRESAYEETCSLLGAPRSSTMPETSWR